MPFLQHFIIEGKHLGTAHRSKVFVHAELQPPQAYAYFCPLCAEIWARCPVEGIGADPNWRVLTMYCRKHSHPLWQVSGSILTVWDEGFVAAFPEEVLRWELQRHFEHYDNLQKEKL